MQSVAYNLPMAHSRPHFPQFIGRQVPLSSPNFILNLSLNNGGTSTTNLDTFVTTNISQQYQTFPESSSSSFLTSTPYLDTNLPYFQITSAAAASSSSYQNQKLLQQPQSPPPESSNQNSPMSIPDSPTSQLNSDDNNSSSSSSSFYEESPHRRSHYKARRGKPLAQFVTPLCVEPKLKYLTRQKLKNTYLSDIPESLIVQSSCNQHSYKVESRRTFHTEPGYLFELTDHADDDVIDIGQDHDDPVICDSSLVEGYLSDGGSSMCSSSGDLRSPSPNNYFSDDNDSGILMDKLYHLEQLIGSDSIRSSRGLY